MLTADAPCPPLTVELYLVLAADCSSYETAPMTFDELVEHVRDGQFSDIRHVLAIKFAAGEGCARDVTRDTAIALFRRSAANPISYNSAAYNLIERALSCWHAHESTYHHHRGRYYRDLETLA